MFVNFTLQIGGLKAKQTILVHAGSGAIGQAAINVALHHGCIVFTTVGSESKRTYIQTIFPQINQSHVGNSRDDTFVQMIYNHTNGKGVDIVFSNSLSDHLMAPSLQCVKKGGQFVEIAKLNMTNDNDLNVKALENGINVTSMTLNRNINPTTRNLMYNLLLDAIGSGQVQPLVRRVFSMKNVEEALRLVSSGTHIGKAVVQFRAEEPKTDAVAKGTIFPCKPKFYCDPKATYIIAGGLGGFGMELAEWLVAKGCRKLILASRSGIAAGFKDVRVR